MPELSKWQATEGESYLAGQRVPAGKYCEIGTHREVCLDKEDVLPASLDGRIACYECVTSTWAQHQQAHILRAAGKV